MSTAVTGGVTSAGVALRNRPTGSIEIQDLPEGAVVTRAVLVWALLFSGSPPSNMITFEDTPVTADLTITVSDDVCWGEDSTIGYASDVTKLVSGNKVYALSDVIGTTRVDSNPSPAGFPLTDGASLFIFYGGPGFTDQVLSDFSYTAVNGGRSNIRMFTGINSVGGTATLHMAGPDGQNNGGENVRITGTTVLNFPSTWEGSAPILPPNLSIGNLWDNDILNVTDALPSGQNDLEIVLGEGADCIGISGVALQMSQ